MEQGKVRHKIGNAESMDRRRFIRNAAITTASVPMIMTLTAQGALAAPCTAVSQRNAGCACSGIFPSSNTAQCINGTTCQGSGGANPAPNGTCQTCVAVGTSRTSTQCNANSALGNKTPGVAASCCSGTCEYLNAGGGTYACT